MFAFAPCRSLASDRGWRAWYQRRARCNGVGTRPGNTPSERGEQSRQVVGVPFAGHVALAEPDQAVVTDATEKRIRIANAHHRRAFAAAAPSLLAGNVDADVESCRRAREHPTGDRRMQRRARCEWQQRPRRRPRHRGCWRVEARVSSLEGRHGCSLAVTWRVASVVVRAGPLFPLRRSVIRAA